MNFAAAVIEKQGRAKACMCIYTMPQIVLGYS